MKYSHDGLIQLYFAVLTLKLLVLFDNEIAKIEFSNF